MAELHPSLTLGLLRLCRLPGWLLPVGTALLMAGCGGSKAPDIASAVKQVQDAAQQAQQTAAQATGISAGSIELTVDAPLKIEQCFARFTPKNGDRPAVLQLTSYDDPQSEKFPSVLLWATADVVSSEELAGKTIQGHLYVQATQDGGIWSSSTLQPIAITVVQADLLAVTCELQEVEVSRADGNGAVKATGKLIGLWK